MTIFSRTRRRRRKQQCNSKISTFIRFILRIVEISTNIIRSNCETGFIRNHQKRPADTYLYVGK